MLQFIVFVMTVLDQNFVFELELYKKFCDRLSHTQSNTYKSPARFSIVNDQLVCKTSLQYVINLTIMFFILFGHYTRHF